MNEPHDEIRCFICHTPGLSGTTPLTIRHDANGFEARMGVAIFGSSNLDEEGMRKAQYNPFHEDFHDNYVSGKGATQEEAIEALRRDQREMHESLWA